MHPTLPYLLSSSDDMLIKLWDWDKGWMCTQIFEGHSHYVMQARALICSAPGQRTPYHSPTTLQVLRYRALLCNWCIFILQLLTHQQGCALRGVSHVPLTASDSYFVVPF